MKVKLRIVEVIATFLYMLGFIGKTDLYAFFGRFDPKLLEKLEEDDRK